MIASINKVIWNKHILVVSVNKIKFWRNSGNLQYSGKCIHMFHACMSFSILRFWVNLPISFKAISWALGNQTTTPVPVTESYKKITWKLWYSPKQRHTRQITCIYYGLLCISCRMDPLNLSLKTAHNPDYLDDDGYILYKQLGFITRMDDPSRLLGRFNQIVMLYECKKRRRWEQYQRLTTQCKNCLVIAIIIWVWSTYTSTCDLSI